MATETKDAPVVKDQEEQPKKSEPEAEAEPEPEPKELLCTICGLRACWQK